VDDVAGGSFVGDIDLDLFGGVQNGAGDRRLFPEPRLRTARARVIWRNTELMVGTDSPLISDLNPLTLAAVGIPDFSGAGNLWNWLGQVRVTREIGSIGRAGHEIRWAVQGAVMSPNASQVAPGDPDAADAGERSFRPALEGRLRARWGGAEGNMTVSQALIATGGGEIGVGIHRGWVAMSNGPPTAVGASRLRESRAVSVDLRAVLMHGLELRGEGYAGRLLRGLGGGGIAQNFGAPVSTAPPGAVGEPVRDVAGWAQLNAQPHPAVLAGAGCGIDVVAPELFPTRLQNTVCAAHLDWRPFQPLVIGAEYRQLATRFATGTFGARHLNLAFGFEI
jgi:hypothetical protein